MKIYNKRARAVKDQRSFRSDFFFLWPSHKAALMDALKEGLYDAEQIII